MTVNESTIPTHTPRCEPVYVQYQFPTQPEFRTPGLPHAPTLSYSTSPNVLLLGTINQSVLLEHLRGPPLVFELHDRDASPELESASQALFGLESQDNLIGTHAFASSDVSRKAKKPSPYGTASLDLGVLLGGQLLLEVTLPVTRGPRCFPPSDRLRTRMTMTSSAQSHLLSPAGVSDHHHQAPPPPGDYLEFGTEITLRLELGCALAFPSVSPTLPAPTTDKMPQHVPHWKRTVRKSIAVSDSGPLLSSPFNRIVYVIAPSSPYPFLFSRSSHRLVIGGGSGGGARGGDGRGRGRTPLIERLLGRVNEINAATLNLDTLAPKVQQAALSTYKLTQ